MAGDLFYALRSYITLIDSSLGLAKPKNPKLPTSEYSKELVVLGVLSINREEESIGIWVGTYSSEI